MPVHALKIKVMKNNTKRSSVIYNMVHLRKDPVSHRDKTGIQDPDPHKVKT